MPVTARPLIVGRRFCGPDASANGGYICGLVAALAAEPVTVRLLKPPPLETELIPYEHDGLLELRHGEDSVAQARPGTVGDLAVPSPPSYEQTVAASHRYAGFARHPAPACFVCGPTRSAGDGLRLFAGEVESGAYVAAPWRPDASLDAGAGRVRPEFMWAALDCPGYLALARDMRPMLLGELTAEIGRRVEVDEACVVIGWKISSAGRKHEAGTAVFGARGDLCARGRAVLIEPRGSE
jgi:hypothetical protein